MKEKASTHLVRVVVMLIRLILGSVFVWAALSKVPRPWELAEEIVSFGLVPAILAPAFAILLITVELVTGLLLILGLRVRLAARVVVLLLAVFIVALSQALLRHLDLTCGCFGGDEPASWWTVARDVGLLLGGIVLLRSLGPRAPNRRSSARENPV